MSRMDTEDFAARFGDAYRELYRHAVRRIDDARSAPSPETTALLLHLAQIGPATLTELARHFDRAPSTLSAKIDALESDGLLARQRDEDDARRSWIWLTAEGRRRMSDALDVLDAPRVARAASRLDPALRGSLLHGLHALVGALAATALPDDGDRK